MVKARLYEYVITGFSVYFDIIASNQLPYKINL